MKNYVDVAGKYAVVTGASGGLGKQFALCLAEQGANVAIVARRMEKLEEVKKEIEAYGVKCVAIKCDVTVSEQITAAVNTIEKEFGRIDILINNAGAGGGIPAVDTPDDWWENIINTNVNGVFFFAREVGKVMKKNHYGRIVNIGSFHCQVTMNGLPRSAYSTSKGAVFMMTKALANEWAKDGITVNTLGPGWYKRSCKCADAFYWVISLYPVYFCIDFPSVTSRCDDTGDWFCNIWFVPCSSIWCKHNISYFICF